MASHNITLMTCNFSTEYQSNNNKHVQLIDFMNLFYGNLEERFKKFQVYNVPTMGMDDFMVVSGMPNVIGEV